MLGVAVAALASCTNEEVVDMPQSRAIQFGTFVNHSTRSVVTETTKDNLNKFFVFGNYGEGTWTPVYTNVEVNGGEVGYQSVWKPSLDAYWESNEQYRFGSVTLMVVIKLRNAKISMTEKQELTFENYTVTNDKDLIVAMSNVKSETDVTTNSPVSLSFLPHAVAGEVHLHEHGLP